MRPRREIAAESRVSSERPAKGGAVNLSHPHAPGFGRGFLFPATSDLPFREFRTNPVYFLVSFLPICSPCNAPAYRNCSQTPFDSRLFSLRHTKGQWWHKCCFRVCIRLVSPGFIPGDYVSNSKYGIEKGIGLVMVLLGERGESGREPGSLCFLPFALSA